MALLRARAFVDAANGIAYAWRTQVHLRVQTVLGAAALATLVLLHAAAIWIGLLAIAIGLVLAFELANTAIEAVVDLVSPQAHPLARAAKDAAAGAVLVASAAAVAFGLLALADTLARR